MVSNYQKESKMKTINKNLDVLFDNWMSEAVKYGDNNFVCDGIMNGYNDWGNQLMRIAFIAKDPHYKNINELTPGVLNGEDYREYDLLEMSEDHRFWRNILTLAYGLVNTDEDSYPDYSDANDYESREYVANNIPFAFVNIKKQAGDSSVSNKVLRQYARRYEEELKEETGTFTPATAKGATKPEEKEPLDEIIEKINEQYKGVFTDADRVMVDVLKTVLMRDEHLKKNAKTSDPRIFAESIFPKAFGTAAQNSYMQSQDAFSSLFADQAKYNAIMHALSSIIYREMRTGLE